MDWQHHGVGVESRTEAELETDRRNGAFWGISTKYSDYANRAIDVDDGWAMYLASIPARLHPFDEETRKQLKTFSFALTDAALRTFVVPENESLSEPVLPFKDVDVSNPPPSDKSESPPIWKIWK